MFFGFMFSILYLSHSMVKKITKKRNYIDIDEIVAIVISFSVYFCFIVFFWKRVLVLFFLFCFFFFFIFELVFL